MKLHDFLIELSEERVTIFDMTDFIERRTENNVSQLKLLKYEATGFAISQSDPDLIKSLAHNGSHPFRDFLDLLNHAIQLAQQKSENSIDPELPARDTQNKNYKNNSGFTVPIKGMIETSFYPGRDLKKRNSKIKKSKAHDQDSPDSPKIERPADLPNQLNNLPTQLSEDKQETVAKYTVKPEEIAMRYKVERTKSRDKTYSVDEIAFIMGYRMKNPKKENIAKLVRESRKRPECPEKLRNKKDDKAERRWIKFLDAHIA